MDERGVHHHHHHQRKAKTMKKKPVKVVYISNPMKVETSVSEFRALVQELTGRGSGLAKFSDDDAGEDGFLRRVSDPHHHHRRRHLHGHQGMKVVEGEIDSVQEEIEPAGALDVQVFGGGGDDDQSSSSPWRSDDSSSIEGFEDVLSAEMLENFDGFFPTSLLFDAPDQVEDFQKP